MSTRNGRLVTVSELFDQVYERAVDRVQENNPGLEAERIAEIAEGITVGAIRFYAMFRRRTKKMMFDIEEATTLSGETGPYVQYAALRGLNILSQTDEIPDSTAVSHQPFNEYDYQVAVQLARYPLVLERCAERYDTTLLAQYLFDLAKDFNRFYEANRVLDAKRSRERRLALVRATVQVFENAFEIAGIPLLRRM